MWIYELGVSGNIKPISFWMCVSRILMHHRKPDAVLLSHEREKKKYLQSCLDQGRRSSTFNGVLRNEAKVVQYCKILQEASTKTCNFMRVKDEHCNCTSHASMHPRITCPHYEPNGRWNQPQSVFPENCELNTLDKIK